MRQSATRPGISTRARSLRPRRGTSWPALAVLLTLLVAAWLLSVQVQVAQAASTVTVHRMGGQISREFTGTPFPLPVGGAFPLFGMPAPEWWGPPAFSSPLYEISIQHADTTGADWTVFTRYELQSTDRFPVTAQPRYQKYLEPLPEWVQSDDPELIALALQLTEGCEWESEAVERIAAWVASHIRYEDVNVVQDALAVYRRGTAVCMGYTNLTTALLRAAGIPCGSVNGLVVSCGLHAWNVIYFPSAGWLQSEPQGWALTQLDWVIPSVTPCWQTLGSNGLMVGLSAREAVNTTTLEGTTSLSFLDGNDATITMPTVVHEAPPLQPAPHVDIEASRTGVPFVVSENGWEILDGPWVRGSLSGSPTAAWCKWLLDDRVIVEGAPTLAVGGSGGLWDGRGSTTTVPTLLEQAIADTTTGAHTLAIEVYDVRGQVSRAELPIAIERRSATPAPTVTSFLPASGVVGTVVTVIWSGFTGATKVAFNGIPANFDIVYDSRIAATVPAGATTGTITVTNPVGTGASASSFAVTGTALSLTVTAPTGTSSYAVGDSLTELDDQPRHRRR